MTDYLVNAIAKPNRQSLHEHITHIGNNDGKCWRMTRRQAISRIERKLNPEKFYTIDKATGKHIYIGVVREVGKLPFLRTYADGKWNDNLLAQPECNTACSLVG